MFNQLLTGVFFLVKTPYPPNEITACKSHYFYIQVWYVITHPDTKFYSGFS